MKQKSTFLSKLSLTFLLGVFLNTGLTAQTTLVAGDIAFSGYISNTTNQIAAEDGFSFVLLRAVASGTSINFTDRGWRRVTGVFNGASGVETTITWTASSALPAGTEVNVLGLTASTGTITGTILSLNGPNGDQIIAYQGLETSPTFISAIHANMYSPLVSPGDPTTTTDAVWDNDVSSSNASGLPTGLTTGVNAIWLSVQDGTEFTNGIFNCGPDVSTATAARAALNNRANWTRNKTIPPGFTLPSGCSYLVSTAPSFTTNPSASSSCAGLSVVYNAVATGSGITFSWQQANDAGFTTGVTTLSNTGIYSISSGANTSTLTISDNTTVNGRFYRCVATNGGGTTNSTVAGLTATANLLPTGNTSVTQTVGAGNSSFFFASACRLISKVLPNGAGPVSGNVTTEVWVEGAVPTAGGIPFVQRHYQVTPASGTSGRVTLYFTQTEFNNFNAAPGSALNLPTGPADNAGKANLRIGKFAGSSSDGSGLPASYAGARTLIDPVDTDIVWDATNNRWAVTFDVTGGFSGFVVQSSLIILPVTLQSFTAKLNPDKTTALQWVVAEQSGMSEYIVEESTNGSVFRTLGVVAANDQSSYTYSFTDVLVNPGRNYYRIKAVDLSGKITYSAIASVNLKENMSVVLYPNPVRNTLTLQQFGTLRNTKAVLLDNQGRTLQTIRISNLQQQVDMRSYPSGMYMLKLEDGTILKLTKQ